MKKLLLALTVMFLSMVTTKPVLAANTEIIDIKSFAFDYLNTSKGMFGQVFFAGLVKGRAMAMDICVAKGTKNGVIYSAVAKVLLTDPNTDAFSSDWEAIDYALLKSFPCPNL